MKTSRLLFGLAAIVMMIAAAVPASAGGQPSPGNNPGLERAIAAQEAHTPELMARRGVIGTAVGHDDAGNPRVAILTDRPGVSGLPGEVDGVPTVVENIGTVTALKNPCGGPPSQRPAECSAPAVDPTSRFDRPVPIGVSTGHPDITAGTIGARVTDGTDVYALSNNHVYADENQATRGDAVIQPGTYDGGASPADDIGTLTDFEEIVFDDATPNTIDAAIARSNTEDLGNATPSDGYGTPSSETVAAAIGMAVEKYGRTTGLTSGSVDLVNATIRVGYDSGVAVFVNQIVVTPGTFSSGGDSGSLIVTADGNHPVGLLFAGSSTRTIANPIDAVLSHFGVSIDGSGGTTPPPPSGAVTVEEMTPDSAVPGAVVDSATVTGSGFQEGATVTFVNGKGPAPSASEFTVVDGGTRITFTLTVPSGGPRGSRAWDVQVTNPDGSSDTLAGALTINP